MEIRKWIVARRSLGRLPRCFVYPRCVAPNRLDSLLKYGATHSFSQKKIPASLRGRDKIQKPVTQKSETKTLWRNRSHHAHNTKTEIVSLTIGITPKADRTAQEPTVIMV